jgi:hypothetical protein
MRMNLRVWVTGGLLLAAAFLAARLILVYEERSQTPPARRKSPDTGIPKELDTLDLKVLNFYTTEKPVRGKPFVLCYGVINAESVSLDPPLADISPAVSRCVEARLDRETALTLRATGRNGEQAAASFTLGVAEPRPEFLFVSVSGREVKRGSRFTLCYGVRNATRVRLDPPVAGAPLAVSRSRCTMWPMMTAPGRLVADGPGGRDEVALPVKVVP